MKLINYIKQIRGVSYKPSDVSNTEKIGYIPLLRANNIKDGMINFDDLVYIRKEIVKNDQVLQYGDILICTSSGSKELVGKAGTYRFEKECTFGAFCKVVRAINIDKDYLASFFQSQYYRKTISQNSRGANINNLKQSDFDELNINVPNTKSQTKIAKQLNILFNLINIKKQQIEKCNDLIKSQFAEMFENKNYPMLSGKELFTFSSGKFLEQAKRKKDGIPVYGGNGIAWYTDKPLINFDTIVIGRVGAYCGNVKIIEEPVWITDNAIYIKEFKQNIYNIKYLYYMMDKINFSKYAQHSGQPKITQRPLEEQKYIVPPTELQKIFANIVDKINIQKSKFEDSSKKLEEMQSALMQEYFG